MHCCSTRHPQSGVDSREEADALISIHQMSSQRRCKVTTEESLLYLEGRAGISSPVQFRWQRSLKLDDLTCNAFKYRTQGAALVLFHQ